MDRFPVYISRILTSEGGFTNNAHDLGNWTGGRVGVGKLLGTKYGIAANTYPDVDIPNLTQQQAATIYRRDFWDAINGDALPPALAYQVLDAAVNHGKGTAIRLLQAAAGVAADGKFGPVSLSAVITADPTDLVLGFMAQRIEFYTNLSTFASFGKGWMRRMAADLRYAREDN